MKDNNLSLNTIWVLLGLGKNKMKNNKMKTKIQLKDIEKMDVREISERIGNPLEREILNDYYISYVGEALRDRFGPSKFQDENSDLTIKRYPLIEEHLEIIKKLENLDNPNDSIITDLADYGLIGFGMPGGAINETRIPTWFRVEEFFRKYVRKEKGKKFLELPAVMEDLVVSLKNLSLKVIDIDYREEGLDFYNSVRSSKIFINWNLPKPPKNATKINYVHFAMGQNVTYFPVEFGMLFERDCFCIKGNNKFVRKIFSAYGLNLQKITEKQRK